MGIIKVLVMVYVFLRFTWMVNVSGAGIVKVLKEIFIIYHGIHGMKYCFGCDGQFGVDDGIASSRSSSYRHFHRHPEV